MDWFTADSHLGHRNLPNLHGHTHSKNTRLDPTIYKCVSVEHTNYAPIPLIEVLEWIKMIQFKGGK